MIPPDHDSERSASVLPIGEQLRVARTKQGWSVQEVATRLRIRTAFVDALERDDYAPFGAVAYARGQLRNYIRLLGLDEHALLQGFRPPAGSGRGQPLRRAPELHPGRPRLVRLGGVAIVAVLAVLGALWANGGRDPQAPVAESEPVPASAAGQHASPQPGAEAAQPSNPVPEPAIPAEPRPAATDAAVAAVEPTSGSAATPASENVAAAPPIDSPAPEPGDTRVELRLRSRAVSWVEVTDHAGQRLVYELVSPGPERVVRGEPPLRLLLGNAPAVDVLYNGKPVTLPTGQHVVRMTLGTAPPQSAPASSDTAPSGAAPPAATP